MHERVETMGRAEFGRQRWIDLATPLRVTMVGVGSVEVALKAWSLVDLARRPPEKVRGPKAAWAVGLAVVNSLGVLPIIYLIRGRRR